MPDTDYEVPEPGTKFKVPKHRGLYAFIKEDRRGDVVWWDFINVENGKRYSFYPDEVVKSGDKKRSERRFRELMSIEDIDLREHKIITIGGETIKVL